MQQGDLIPTLNISAFDPENSDGSRMLAAEVDRACREIGFLVIEGHGVSQDLIADIHDKARQFFDLPAGTKAGYQEPDDVYYGYKGTEHAALAYSLGDENAQPDLREQFGTGRPDEDWLNDPCFQTPRAGEFLYPVRWPGEIPGFREAYTAYYQEMVRLSERIMQLFAVAMELPADYFDSIMERHVSNMAVYNYPEQLEKPRQGQLRGGAHTDFGSLTIVHADWSAPGGLQVYTKDTGWIDVPARPGTFVINLGDMMERWTNERWVSTLHRVANPSDDAARTARRQSIVFFHIPNHDAVVECLPTCTDANNPPKYPPITIGDHQLMKMGKMYTTEEEALE